MQVITGKHAYVARRMNELMSRGYIALSTNHWSDGTMSVKMVLVRTSK